MNPTPKALPRAATVAMHTAVHVTKGCTAFEMPRGTRVPAVNPKSVASSIDSCLVTGASFESTVSSGRALPSAAITPDTKAPKPNLLISQPLNAGSAGLEGVWGEEEAAACVAAGGREGGDRDVTTAAVETRLKNHPPRIMRRSLAAFVVEGAGDKGRTTRLGTKNTGNHLVGFGQCRG